MGTRKNRLNETVVWSPQKHVQIYWKENNYNLLSRSFCFLIFQPKHMLWLLKRIHRSQGHTPGGDGPESNLRSLFNIMPNINEIRQRSLII